MIVPPLARVRQSIPQPLVADVPATVRRLVLASRLRERVARGSTIAVGIGSRGIHGIDAVARAVVSTLLELGYKPFIVAAMGSHGGATSEGQRAASGRLRHHARSDGRAGQDGHGCGGCGHQPGRAAHLL